MSKSQKKSKSKGKRKSLDDATAFEDISFSPDVELDVPDGEKKKDKKKKKRKKRERGEAVAATNGAEFENISFSPDVNYVSDRAEMAAQSKKKRRKKPSNRKGKGTGKEAGEPADASSMNIEDEGEVWKDIQEKYDTLRMELDAHKQRTEMEIQEYILKCVRYKKASAILRLADERMTKELIEKEQMLEDLNAKALKMEKDGTADRDKIRRAAQETLIELGKEVLTLTTLQDQIVKEMQKDVQEEARELAQLEAKAKGVPLFEHDDPGSLYTRKPDDDDDDENFFDYD